MADLQVRKKHCLIQKSIWSCSWNLWSNLERLGRRWQAQQEKQGRAFPCWNSISLEVWKWTRSLQIFWQTDQRDNAKLGQTLRSHNWGFAWNEGNQNNKHWQQFAINLSDRESFSFSSKLGTFADYDDGLIIMISVDSTHCKIEEPVQLQKTGQATSLEARLD